MIHSIRELTKPNAIDLGWYSQKAETAVLYTGIAVSTLGSFALAYTHPTAFLITGAAVTLINIYALPEVIKTGRINMIKVALAASFISMNSLILGGCGALIVSDAGSIFRHFLENHHLGSFLFSLFGMTAIGGYVIPTSLKSLQKSINVLKSKHWEKQAEQLSIELKKLSKQVTNPLIDFWERSSSLISILAPRGTYDLLLYLHMAFRIPLSKQAFTLRNGFSTADVQNFLNELKEINLNYIKVSSHNKKLIYEMIKNKVLLVPKNSTEAKVNYLLDQAKWLVPGWMTKQDFGALFQENFLANIDARSIAFAMKFDEPVKWLAELKEMKLHLKPVQEGEANNLEQIANQLQEIKNNWTALDLEKKRLQIFHEMCGKSFNLYLDEFIPCELSKQINELILNISQVLESAKTKTNESKFLGPVALLGSNRCNFKMADYEEVQECLNLAELDEEAINEHLQDLGLATEQDFYIHGIMPSPEELKKNPHDFTKDQIKQNLKKFIQRNLPSVQQTEKSLQVQAKQSSYQKVSARLEQISQKVSRTIYLMIAKGLILVPCIIYPVPAAIGFGLGAIYFTFRRFGCFEEASGILESLKENFMTFRLANYLVQRRRLLSNTVVMQQNARAFAQNNLFEKIRIISNELLCTLIITGAPILTPGGEISVFGSFVTRGMLGPFAQGALLSHEVVHLF